MTAEEGSFIRGVGIPMLRCNARWVPVDANQAALTLFGEATAEALCARLRSISTQSNAIHDLDVGRILITRAVVDDANLLQCAAVGEAPHESVPPLVRLYAEAFRASPTPTMVADRRSRKPIDVNPAWLSLLGYARPEIEHLSGQDVWAFPEDRQQYNDAVRANGGEMNGFETSLRSKSGELIPVQIFSRLIDKKDPDFAVTVVIDLSEQRRHEEELLAEEQRLRTSQSKLDAIFRDSPTPTLIFDPAERRVIEMNDAMEALTGYTVESAAEVDLSRLWVEPDARDEFLRLAAEKRVDGFPATIRRRDGGPIRVLIYRDVIEAEERELTVTQMVDVSALHASEERFERLFRHTPTPTVLLSLDSEVLDANVAAERLFQIDRATMRGDRSRRWVDVAVRDRFIREIRQSGRVSDFHAEFFNGSGGTVSTTVSGQVISDRGSLELLMQFVELRDHESDELERTAALAQLEQAQELARVGGFTWDLSTGIVQLSPQLAALHGLAPGPHSPEVLLEFVVEADRERVRAGFGDMGGQEGRRVSIDYDIELPESGLRCCRTVAVLREYRGRWYIAGVTQDVTDERRAEQARLDFEASVQHTQKLESLGVLAGGIAHDFNNLLTGILGNTELALRVAGLPESARDSLETVFSASQRASDLTYQLLVYSGKGKFDMEPVDLSALVEDISGLLELSISRDSRLVLDCAGGLNGIRADRSQVQQIVMNLIINASEAMEGREGRIEVRTRAVTLTEEEGAQYDGVPAGDYIGLRVTDDGVGMTPEVKERIFEPFFTSKFAGRGLGMAAVMGIVHAHNGGLCIESEAGVGTSVWVVFPALGFPAEAPKPEAPRAQVASAAAQTVLVVDDDLLIREYAQRLLGTSGYRTIVAPDGVAALELVDQADVVLLDVTMPGMTGIDVIERLNQRDAHPPVVMMSGYGESRVEGTEYRGALRFVAKPFTANALLKTVSDALLMSGQEDQE